MRDQKILVTQSRVVEHQIRRRLRRQSLFRQQLHKDGTNGATRCLLPRPRVFCQSRPGPLVQLIQEELQHLNEKPHLLHLLIPKTKWFLTQTQNQTLWREVRVLVRRVLVVLRSCRGWTRLQSNFVP